ncbi:glycosyltransferase family 4 protein [Cloacibacterium sp. TD35]|uniref:glycosyltransferase family 4 protein n=1 Tax=Cloacibacterium sp. TD35 TaxID=2976818 RepID=UPI00237D6748|nr:glycosyltransferase family 4 protein [Cloacibacterium sp. TD35]WDT68120.1 glycosyltransferase family 4 protein [Cloacibacterium sp. TD35]
MQNKPKLFRISTVPMSLNLLLRGQLRFLNEHFEVTAISGAGDDLETVADREGVKVHEIEMHRPISLRQDLKSLWKLYWYFKKEKPDIIHSITPKAGLLSMLAGKLAGVPIRMHTFTGLIFPHKSGYMKSTLIIMDKILCGCATHLYPEGKGVKADLINYKITNKPLKVIANGNVNGVDVDYYCPKVISQETKDLLREELHIYKDDFVFIFVGRLVIDKGLRELVKAFEKENKNNKKIKLILVGSKEKVNHLHKRNIFRNIHNHANIISVGFQEDVRPYFAISNVLVLPSYREGFPNVVLQAGAMGLPCIVSDISGCNEIITHHMNGILVPRKNTLKLQEAMQMMLERPQLVESLQKNARKIVVELFNKEIVWAELKKEYEKILKENKN